MNQCFKPSKLNLSIKFALGLLIASSVSTSMANTPPKALTNVQRDANVKAEKTNASPVAANGHARYLARMPYQGSGYYGAGRFGESRDNNKRPHQGLDMTIPTGTKLYAMTSGKVVGVGGTASGAGLSIMGSIGESDAIFSYWHLDTIPKKFQTAGVPFTAGEHIANSGATGGTIYNPNRASGAAAKNYPPHLHLGIGVPSSQQAIQAWLNNTPNRANTVYIAKNFAQKSATHLGVGTVRGSNAKRKAYYYTHPAPYLNQDVLIRTSAGNADKLIPFIGNTNRTHYNALVGARVLPPTSKSYNGITPKEPVHKGLPTLKVSGAPISNDQLMAANQAVTNSAAAGELDDQFLNSGSYTADEYAYYAVPRTIFGGSADEVTIDIGDGDITAAEHIEKISKKRFGNKVWDAEMLNISMRGMLTEYLNIINAENYIKKEILKQQDTIETLMATWTAVRARRVMGQEIIKTFEKAQDPDVIPKVSSIPLEQLLDIGEYDMHTAGMGVNIPTGKYCQANVRNAFINRFSAEDKKWLIALAHKTGFAPNDMATVIFFESSFREVYPSTWDSAAGFIQLTKSGLSGVSERDILSNPVTARWYNGSAGFKWGVTPIGQVLKKMRSAGDKRAEWAMYEAYLNTKYGINWSPQDKSLPVFYSMVTGGPYPKGKPYTNVVINRNPQWDVNKDGQIDLFEPSLSPSIRSALCPFFTNEQHDPKHWGLTDDELQPFKSLKRNKQNSKTAIANHYQALERIKTQMGFE